MPAPRKSSFSKLAKFTAISWAEGCERFQLDETDDDVPGGFGIAVSDAFGDDPEEVFVHDGNVHCESDVVIGSRGDYAGVYVIDGDLAIEGVFDFTQVDGAAIVLVTGSLRAKTVAVAQEAQLWVGKDLEARDYILAGVSDAGGLAVRGRATAKAMIVTDAETVSFGKKPKVAKVIASCELDEEQFPRVLSPEDALVERFADEPDHAAMVAAAKSGKALLR